MYEVDKSGHLGHDVLTVKPLEDYMLLLGFDTGEQRVFDVKPWFKYNAYKPIMEKEVFMLARVDYGTVVWPGNIDYCPDNLYAGSLPVTESAEAYITDDNYHPMPQIVAVKPLDDYNMLVSFDNGEKRIFDAKPLFSFKVFKPLQDKAFFGLVKVVHGYIEWPDEIFYCPDILYTRSVPVDEGEAVSAGLSAVAEPRQNYERKE